MPKISVHLGLTFPGSGEFTSNRCDVSFDDIDVAGDVPAQLEACKAALETTATEVEAALATEAANISGLSVGGLGLARSFAEFREKLNKWQENVVAEVRRQKEVLEKLATPKTVAVAPSFKNEKRVKYA